MSETVLVDISLSLPAADIQALIEGRMIAAMAPRWINQGEKFALYPANILMNSLPLERHYRSSFLPIAQKVFTNLGSQTVLIQAWAKCELCQMLDSSESLDALSRLTIWTTEALQQTLSHRPYIFLAFLRVYLLPQQIEMSVYTQRNFLPLPQQLILSQVQPVLSDRVFHLRKHQLETRQPPQHPELEDLQSALAAFAIHNPVAEELENNVKVFLGWSSKPQILSLPPDLAWINDIAALGVSSKEQDEGKSNYQAGTDFENIVRKSLEFLGFTVDYFHKGGAGGVDVFCSKPYPLIGECKAGKKIPNPTAVQLLNLGTLRLQSQELFKQAAKLIIGPGEPTTQLKDAATIQGMAIINPKTLEKLVQLQNNYRGSVDLFKLKKYLKPGHSDDEVEKYIQQVERDIKLRSHIITAVKQLGESGSEHLTVEIRVQYNAVFTNEQISKLDDQAVNELLIELSSPLTGYLGRIKGSDWRSDRFYFLRDLPITYT